MIALALAGIVLIVIAPFGVRLAVGRKGDPTVWIRIVQLVGFVLLVGALIARPYNPDTAAVPPPPDAIDGRSR